MPQENLSERAAGRLSIVVLGNDALLEALPARPIQLANACHAAGFDLVVPESWGDELVAHAVLTQLADRSAAPVVFCACPLARERLYAVGSDLEPMLLTTSSPSVATARYIRALYRERLVHITFVGSCPAANAPEFDERFLPGPFLQSLGQAGISVENQPSLFQDILTPDRRRFWSVPGGCPTPDALWSMADERLLARLAPGEFAIELAQWLVSRESVLIDVNPALGCACAGITTRTPTPPSASVAVASLEPPRANSPVVSPDLVADMTEPRSRAPSSPREPGAPRRSGMGGSSLPREMHAGGAADSVRR